MSRRWGKVDRILGVSILAGAMLTLPLPMFAQADGLVTGAGSVDSSPAGEKAWWQSITTNGFVSLSYGYNSNQPHSRQNQFRVFDFNDDEPQLDMAQLVVQR